MAEFTVGVVGGLGPETSAKFYTRVVSDVYKTTKKQPNIVIDNVPISAADVEEVSRTPSERIYSILESSVRRLAAIPADLIVIPCNTVHIYFERLQKITDVPILNIIDETAREVKRLGFTKAGVIATTTTVASGLYQRSFAKAGIAPVFPHEIDQLEITAIVTRILDHSDTPRDALFLNEVADKLAAGGAKAVVLGCTDLQLLIKEHKKAVIVDSMESLAKGTVEQILER